MATLRYQGLPEFGLPVFAPDDAQFPALLRDIRARPEPFREWPDDASSPGVILLNESGRAVIVLSYLWRQTFTDGASRANRGTNLGASTQLEMLSGRSPAVEDLGTCVLPGSKRWITYRGMFGNNLDVLPEGQARSFLGGGGGGAGGPRFNGLQLAEAEFVLDFAILADGLCVGPDESGLFDSITASLERVRSAAEQAAELIKQGMPTGPVFELIAPLARHRHMHPEERRVAALTMVFGRMAIDQLINADLSDLLQWLARFAEAPTLPLRRP